MSVLDVSSGKGTQAIYYAKTFGASDTGLDISEEMVSTASKRANENGLNGKVKFVLGDSQQLPFSDNTFNVVINECAVGIPEDSQKVLDEMLRFVKPKGAVAFHESTWKKSHSLEEKNEITERYGTTPLEFSEWKSVLRKAGTIDIVSEFEQWSQPEMFWNIRKDRKVKNHKNVMTIGEKMITAIRIFKIYGFTGVIKVFENERFFLKVVRSGGLGYALFKGLKKE